MPSQRSASLKRGVRLEYFTLSWNAIEAIVGLAAGIAAGSVALTGFALDSIVEAASGGVLLWRLRAETHGGRQAEEVEERAVRLLAIAFLALAAYITIQATVDLVAASRPDESVIGIVMALVSLVVMPLLAWRKRLVARELNSRAMQADSAQTMLCTYLSVVLLFGLLANALFGWWWADPIAGLGIAALAAREGRELWTTKDLCCR